MADLPSGTVTFLFTDIEGSTKLWEEYPDDMPEALARHNALLAEAIQGNGGEVFKTEGDAFCAAFPTGSQALAAALKAQVDLRKEPWGKTGPLKVRVALYTGPAQAYQGDYFGRTVNRAARLRGAAHGGQVLVSQATRAEVENCLRDAAELRDLGEHRLRDVGREHIFQLLHPHLPANFPPLLTLSTHPNNLPAQLSSFVGRQKEMKEVKDLLTTNRLVTLTGAGGCGKTRLVLEAATDLMGQYPDGAWLVELAPLSDPAFVPQAVASALGVREEPGRRLIETLSDHLRPKHLLLVPDNCEHLVEASAQLADVLLRASPKLRILATSWQTLGITGEQVWRVPCLSVPDPKALPPTEGLTQYEGVRLFVERAVSVMPRFALTHDNAPAVASICHRLDGIPLAIEMAAAWVRVLPVERIAEGLEDRFRLLTRGSRTGSPRHQTSRTAIDWGYDLLPEKEQVLFRRLSVFAGGFTLRAAERVCTGEGVGADEVLDLLSELVDMSFVPPVEDGQEARYMPLDTLRQYGQDKLRAAGEEHVLRDRYLDWSMSLAEEAAGKLLGPELRSWLTRLEAERDNLRTVLAWCKSQPRRVEGGLRLVGALRRFWTVGGYWDEGLMWAEALLSASDGSRTVARANALYAAGVLAARQGGYEHAVSRDLEALAIYRELDNKRAVACVLNGLGVVAFERGDYSGARGLFKGVLQVHQELGDEWGVVESVLGGAQPLGGEPGDTWGESATGGARGGPQQTRQPPASQPGYALAPALYDESLARTRELGDKRVIVFALNSLGVLAQAEGDYVRARKLHKNALDIARQVGLEQDVALSLNGLGAAAECEGKHAAARALYQQSLATFQAVGDTGGSAQALSDLGRVAQAQGDYAVAWHFYRESLTIRQELHDRRTALSLEAFAGLAADQGRSERAARLMGAAAARRGAIGLALTPECSAEHHRRLDAVRDALGQEAFSRAWAEGEAMTLEEAIAHALEEADASGAH